MLSPLLTVDLLSGLDGLTPRLRLFHDVKEDFAALVESR
jgi:hypothetical protein